METSLHYQDLINSTYNYQNTLPKSYVHRAVVGEVFLTDIKKFKDDEFVTAGYLPKAHIYYNDLVYKNSNKRIYDAIVLLEICRQSSIIIAHHFFLVPYTSRFIFDNADFEFNKLIYHKAEGSNVLVDVKIIEKKYRQGELSGLSFKMTIYIDGLNCAQKFMSISWLSETKWNRLRKIRNTQNYESPIFDYAPAEVVGRQLLQNVVIGNVKDDESHFIASVIIDQTHPTIFDHPLDHVPGMLLIEACRQMALLIMSKKFRISNQFLFIKRFRINFIRFCELNSSVVCQVAFDKISLYEVERIACVPIAIIQHGNIVTNAELTVQVKENENKNHMV